MRRHDADTPTPPREQPRTALRIVGARAQPRSTATQPPDVAREQAHRDVAHENHAASAAPNDSLLRALLGPRQLFVNAVEASLQGGRAAILLPEDRDALLQQAQRLGLRSFDAYLLIATAQDAARRGERAWLMPAATQAAQLPSPSGPQAPTRRAPAPPAGTPRTEASSAQQSAPIAGQALIALTLALVAVASVAVALGP